MIDEQAPSDREQGAPPTDEDFLEKLGEPTIMFELPLDKGGPIPTGLLTCCRVVHQPNCRHHVAGSLIGILATLRYKHRCDHHDPADDTLCEYLCGPTCKPANEERGNRVEYDGDVLADPEGLRSAVQVLVAGVVATADALGAEVVDAKIPVWLLSSGLRAMWDAVLATSNQRFDERLAESDPMPSEAILALPINLIDEGLFGDMDGLQQRLATLDAQSDFHPVDAYQARVVILPGEIGHDDVARYVIKDVWEAPPEWGA